MICYLVLHYKNIKETLNCLDSIFKIFRSEDRIVIVDNGSGDNSGNNLREKYQNEPRVTVLLLKENVGFSKGNNAGYVFIRQHYDPDFIVVTNNDVVFTQKDFQNKIYHIFQMTQFDVLGPDVYIPDNKEHQNPLFLQGITIEELKKELEEYRHYKSNPQRFGIRLKFHRLKGKFCSRSKLFRRLNSVLRKKDEIDYNRQYENVGLQGSCLIVSRNYIKNEEKMFTPEPFLYCEEVFLYYKCKQHHYKMVYSPEVYIQHKEAATFKYVNKNNKERLEFMLKHHVAAREMLLKYLKMIKV